MQSDTCFCSETVTAPNIDDLVAAVVAHFEVAHPEIGVTPLHARDYLDAKERLSDDTDRLDVIGPVEIRDAADTGMESIMGFFDRDAFAGNPAWADCYCMFHHVVGGPDDDWGERGRLHNREQIRDRIASGATTGVVAVVDGKIVGWCNATGRAAYPKHAGDPSDGETGSIVCFLVAPPYRGHGVARRLLEGACDLLRRSGFRVAEAYPVAKPSGAEAAYRGTPELYAEAGFTDTGDGVMRKPLDSS
jgi:GNAT superfamily N-acetyltransferase